METTHNILDSDEVNGTTSKVQTSTLYKFNKTFDYIRGHFLTFMKQKLSVRTWYIGIILMIVCKTFMLSWIDITISAIGIMIPMYNFVRFSSYLLNLTSSEPNSITSEINDFAKDESISYYTKYELMKSSVNPLINHGLVLVNNIFFMIAMLFIIPFGSTIYGKLVQLVYCAMNAFYFKTSETIHRFEVGHILLPINNNRLLFFHDTIQKIFEKRQSNEKIEDKED